MKVYTDIAPGVLERVLRSTPLHDAHEHVIYSDEGIFTVGKKLHKWQLRDADPYTVDIGGRQCRVDPAVILLSEAWQIPVPHDVVKTHVSTYFVSPRLTFVVEQTDRTECYFSGDDLTAIPGWLDGLEAVVQPTST